MYLESGKTVAEIAAGSLGAVRVFERYGIDYCCGGKRPLADVCQSKGLEAASVEKDLLEAMSADDHQARDWNAAPLAELIPHIVNRHHEYLRREFPAIGARLEKVYRVYNERYGEALPGLPEAFTGLREELEQHLDKEEAVLFPAILAYEKAANSGASLPVSPFGSVANPIKMMEQEHESAGAALVRIREITGDFSLPDYACVTYKALMSGLRELEQDLHQHIHLENNIVFPRVLKLEAEGNQA
jgi:regulator of cell morphogenesis and NO signaling